MVNPKNVNFPLTLAAFTALQEAELGRKAEDLEQEVFALIVEMANEAFTAGMLRNLTQYRQLLAAISAVDTDGDPFLCHLCALSRGWIIEGFRRGLELPPQSSAMPS